MLSSRHFGLAAVLVGALTASAFCQPDVTDISPASGTTGDFFTIEGSGFGEKPKVRLVTIDGEKVKKAKGSSVKVVKGENDDNTILVELRKGIAGEFFVEVKNGKEVDRTETFTIVPPDISADALDPGDPKSMVTVAATNLGNKKPKVLVGGKKAKVVSFGPGPEGGFDEVISFLIPKIPNGTWGVELLTKVGSDLELGVVTVENSTAKLGKPSLKGKIGGKSFSAKGFRLVVTDLAGTLSIAASKGSKSLQVLTITLIGFSVPSVNTGLQVGKFLGYQESHLDGFIPMIDATYTGTAWQVELNAEDDAGRISGSFSGTLFLDGVSNPETNIDLAGSFIVEPNNLL